MCKSFLLVWFFLFVLMGVNAQSILPMHRHWTIKAEKQMIQLNAPFHTGIKPFIISDTSQLYKSITTREGEPRNWVDRKLRYENFILVENENYRLTADPILYFEGLKNKSIDELFYRNTRGFYVAGRVGKSVSFYSTLYENQLAYQPFIQDFIETRGVIPFGANYKPYEAPISSLYPNGYDFSLVEGVISWNALPILNLQLGQAKQFVGEGYRSLLLSDNGYNYPFLKATVNYSIIQYSSMYAEMMDFDLPNSAESGYHKKRYGMQYLSFRISKHIQIGLFESIVYNPEDSIGYKSFKPNYVNPVIFSRAIEYGLNGKNNVMLGLVWRVSITPELQQYGQIVLDEFGTNAKKNHNSFDNKTGFQLGIKWFKALTTPNLYMQGEYNRVRPFTYGTVKTSQNFSHAKQSFAHPMEANFHEFVGILSYQIKDLEFELQGNIMQYATDTVFKAASNIFASQADNNKNLTEATFLQGNKTNLIYGQMQLSYLLNPATDLRLYMGVGYRKQWDIEIDKSDVYLFLGLRTFLSNNLFDF